MTIEMLPAGASPQIRVSSTSGRVRVIAEDRSDIDVPAAASVTREGPALTVTTGSDALLVRIPAGLAVVIGTEASRVEVAGPVGDLAVVTTSGRVSVDAAAGADVRTTSGRVEIGSVHGACRIRTGSGAVRVQRCGSADVATESGRIRLEEVDGAVSAHCTSGRITVGLVAAHRVEAETVSGRIDISVPSDIEPDVRTELPAAPLDPDDAHRCIIAARSVSGRIEVSRR